MMLLHLCWCLLFKLFSHFIQISLSLSLIFPNYTISFHILWLQLISFLLVPKLIVLPWHCLYSLAFLYLIRAFLTLFFWFVASCVTVAAAWMRWPLLSSKWESCWFSLTHDFPILYYYYYYYYYYSNISLYNSFGFELMWYYISCLDVGNRMV